MKKIALFLLILSSSTLFVSCNNGQSNHMNGRHRDCGRSVCKCKGSCKCSPDCPCKRSHQEMDDSNMDE